MTSANVFNWTVANASPSLNANAVNSGSKAEKSAQSFLFASMMSPNYSASMPVSSTGGNDSSWGNGETSFATVDAYESNSRRNTFVSSEQKNPIEKRVEELSDTFSDFEEDVREEVAEILGVDKDRVTEAMELLGLTVFDLLNPQNLASLAMELTGSTDSCELIMRPEFMELMQAMDSAAEELMQNMELPMQQLKDVVSQIQSFMNREETFGTVSAQPQEVSSEEISSEEAVSGLEDEEGLGEGEFLSEEEMELDTQRFFAEEDPEVDDGYEDWQDAIETDDDVDYEFMEAEGEDDFSEDFNESWDGEDASSFLRENKDRNSSQISDSVSGMQHVVNETGVQNSFEVPQADSGYSSVDALEIIKQVVEKIKLCVTEKISSMEMQLNPEHLGKVTLQVSNAEGEINARIIAANEAVKNALETQMTLLKEQMNEAGMKVNAIEVTVSAHGFEKNLEQNQGQDERRGEEQNQNMNRRRNINLSALDDLMGLMSEEEALIAQIMKDNGNSVDLSA